MGLLVERYLDTLYLFTYWIRTNWLQLRLLLEVFLANANQQLVLERWEITVDYC